MRLLREAGGVRYAFSHALTQRALYEQLSARRRLRLHLVVAEVLERLPERDCGDAFAASRPSPAVVRLPGSNRHCKIRTASNSYLRSSTRMMPTITETPPAIVPMI